MLNADPSACRRPTTVAFVNCFNGTAIGRTVHLTEREKLRLCRVLMTLRDAGLILRPNFAPAHPGFGFAEIVELLRTQVGGPMVDAALAAEGPTYAGSDPDPVAVMPVWGFVPEGDSDDVLISSARLWGTDLLIEALRVEDVDDPVPVSSVRDRHAGWMCASGADRLVKAVQLPGQEGSYVVFAASAPV